ncbi:MAG: amidotransferase 1, exosortase A system-associated [Gammaproteobacteria bacterium]|nr:amidotransferase 1, exosortase A system-associated [Gammaproteobacteria bacterium]
MCGLVGIFDLRGERMFSRTLLWDMNETQHHRGPDETGIHLEPGVGLGHKRLSIIDLSSGQQPLFNEDDSVVVVFNGEIYNFQTLVPELEACGHRFKTHSDTEVIVHAWEEWGESCVTRFRGMFAFALWDRNRHILFLARDRLGVKPLYYADVGGLLLFASELKALAAHPEFSRTIDPPAVEEYFAFGYIPEPRTIYASAKKLPPGTTLTVKRGAALPNPRQYWDLPSSEVITISEDDACAELLSRIRDAVKIRLISEVPLGAFLSGGVDSSAVVAAMAELMGDSVNTCSISFQEQKYDESRYATMVAERYHTNHRSETVASDDFALIDRLATIYDEPYADSSAMPTYRVCELARKHVTVALSGDGGGENLAGYGRYRGYLREEKMRGLLPLSVRRPLFGMLAKIYPKADRAPRFLGAKSTFQALASDSVEGYFNGVSIVREPLRRQLFTAKFQAGLDGYRAVEVMRRHAATCPSDHPLSKVQYLDFKTYLPGDILTKVDRASMAHSLEVREPLLDHPLTEWLWTLPPDLKLRGSEGKYVFKRALESQLPAEVLYRKKMGFSIPLTEWLRGPLRERVRATLTSPCLVETGIFNIRYLTQIFEQHVSGQRDHSAPLWTVLMFESFLRQHQQ